MHIKREKKGPWGIVKREGIEKLLLLFLFLLLVFILSYSFSDLPGNSSAEDLGAEETALGSLNDLLVNWLWWVVHDNGALLVVNLCIDASVTDQVDDPLLTLVLGQTKTLGKVPSSC
jgi:hypothetical protein